RPSGHNWRSWISEVWRVEGQLHLRRDDYCGFNRKLRMIVANHDRRRRNLLHRRLWNFALRRLKLAAIAAATAAAHLRFRGLDDRLVHRRSKQRNSIFWLFDDSA